MPIYDAGGSHSVYIFPASLVWNFGGTMIRRMDSFGIGLGGLSKGWNG